jgi:hypothetical protein
MGFSSAAMSLRGEALKLEGPTGGEEAERFDVWAMMTVRAADRLDDVMEKIDMHMATQLMKAAMSLHVTNAVRRSEDSGAASQ